MTALRMLASRLGALALVVFAVPALAATDAVPTPGAIKLSYVHRVMNERMELKRERQARRRPKGRKGGESLRPAPREEGWTAPSMPHRSVPILRGAGGPPTNHLVNDRTGDAGNSGQCETSIAAFGDKLVAAWNDGEGFNIAGDTQGWGYSADGGATWTDMGAPPKIPGISGFQWTSDPVLAVNEKTGAFYYTALWGSPATGDDSYIGIIKGRFTGSTFTWGTPRVVRRGAGLQLDKQWIVADSSSGRLLVSYTNFNAQGSQIEFQFADSNGVSWSSPRLISLLNSTERGFVQGSRPAVTADGTVYVMYYLIGIDPNDPNAVLPDYFRVARSVDGGTTFSSPVTAATFWTNFGTGAPGFNRPVGIQFAGMAVDRGFDAHRGRVFLTFAESINWLDDVVNVGQSGYRSEIESNDVPGTATPIVVGNSLRGDVSAAADIDFFAAPLVAGQHLIVEADSAAAGLVMSLRLVATDGATFLTYTNNRPADGQSMPLAWMFTAPATGTYYIRVRSLGGTGGYRLRTGYASRGSERGRDQRDVFVTSSDDGTTWSNPVRANASPVGYDDWLPEVAVASNGGVYCSWFDFRDAAAATNGGQSSIRMAFSADGGASVAELGRVTDALSDWTNSGSNIAPNQGDYQFLFASETSIHSCWSDVRLGNPDVFTASLPLLATGMQVRLQSAQAAPRDVQLVWQVTPPDTLTARLYRSDDGGPYNYLDLVTANGSGRIAYTDTTALVDHTYRYRLGVFIGGVEYYFGQANVTILSNYPLALGRAWPNPTSGGSFSIAATFATSGPATLTLHDLTGREVLRHTLNFSLGPHTVVVTPPSTLRQGVYVVTLRQNNRNVSTRVTYLR